MRTRDLIGWLIVGAALIGLPLLIEGKQGVRTEPAGPVVPPPTPISAEGIEVLGFNDLDQPQYCTTEVEVMGSTAYVSSWCGMNDRGVTVVDVSEPTVPTVITRTEIVTGNTVVGISAFHMDGHAHQGDLLLEPVGVACAPAAAETPSTLRIWNIDEPDRPRLLASLVTGDSVWRAEPFERDGKWYALLVSAQGDIADNSVCGWEEIDLDAGVAIAEIDDPRQPRIIGRWSPRAQWPDLPGATYIYSGRVDAEGRYAYVSGNMAGMMVLDLADLTMPVGIGRFVDPEVEIFRAYDSALLDDGEHLALADFNSNAVEGRFSVLEPPTLAGDYETLAGWKVEPLMDLASQSLDGEVIFVGRGCSLEGQDPDPYLADPSGRIALIQRGACSFNSKIERAFEAGATAVVIFNHIPDAGPAPVGGAPPPGVTIPAVGVDNAIGTALTTTLASGITPTVRLGIRSIGWGYTHILDISDPSMPREVAEYTIPETHADPPVGGGYDWYSSFGLRVEGDLLYVAQTGAGIRVVDVAHPTEPREIAHLVPADRAHPDGTSTLNQTLDSARGPQGELYIADEISGLWALRETWREPPAPGPILLPWLAAETEGR